MIVNNKKLDDGKQGFYIDGELILTLSCTEDEADKLVSVFITELSKEIDLRKQFEFELGVATKMMEYLGKILKETLSDKLSELDTVYAMKNMLDDMANLIVDMIPRLEELNEKQDNKE